MICKPFPLWCHIRPWTLSVMMKQLWWSPKPNCVGSLGQITVFAQQEVQWYSLSSSVFDVQRRFCFSSPNCQTSPALLPPPLDSTVSCTAFTLSYTHFLVHSRTQTQIQPSRLEVYCLPFCRAVWAFELPWPGTYPAQTTYKKGGLTYGAAFPLMQSAAAGLELSPLMDLNFSCELEMIPMCLDAVVAADLLSASTKALALVACALLLAWSHTRQSSVPGEHPTLTAVYAKENNAEWWIMWTDVSLLQVRPSVWV